jgi:hypothetical protein
MVYNSTDINKTNNHLSTKESLNSDGQQFHRYQQNEVTSQLSSLNSIKGTIYDVGNLGHGLGQTQECGGSFEFHNQILKC